MRYSRRILALLCLGIGVSLCGCSTEGLEDQHHTLVARLEHHPSNHDPDGGDPESIGAQEQYQVPKPPFSKNIFPCSRCHSVLPNNYIKRKLEKEHTNIVLEHGVRDRWCFDCHIQDHRDKLRMSSGGTVAYSESYKLCGQCHGPKLRDWRLGIHGKRTGSWNGAKQYLLCVHCHNPHSPRFKPIKPLPPPRRPADLKLEK